MSSLDNHFHTFGFLALRHLSATFTLTLLDITGEVGGALGSHGGLTGSRAPRGLGVGNSWHGDMGIWDATSFEGFTIGNLVDHWALCWKGLKRTPRFRGREFLGMVDWDLVKSV
jgi:hypothetical protein